MSFQVDVKLINGAQVQIDATGGGSSVTVGGLYSPAAQIRSTGKVDVSSCHGRVDVSTTGASGPVSLASVNGAAQVSTGMALPTRIPTGPSRYFHRSANK